MRYIRIIPVVVLALNAVPAFAQSEASCPSGGEDVRVAALSGLAPLDAEQVLPVMKKILERRDTCSIALRRQVLGFLYRGRYGDQTDVLLNVARTDPSSEVRRYAVQVLSQGSGERAVSALDSIAFSSADMELRDAALRALAQQSAPAARASLRRAAEQASLPIELRMHAVSYISGGRRSADDAPFLIALYAKTEQADLRETILRAIANQRSPDATNFLLGIARDKNRDIDVRRQALSAVGQAVRGNETASVTGLDVSAVLGLYDSFSGQVEMQDRALDVISQRPESIATDKLLQIARNEPNIELRKKAILRVGQRRDPRVREFLLEMLNK